MITFLSSDHHFGHQKIPALARRPFDSVEEMGAALIERWNTVVSPEDEVIYLGDFAMGAIAETLPVARQLNGTKYLVPGNHDRCWRDYHKNGTRPDKRSRSIAAYQEVGFVFEYPRVLVYDGHAVTLSHFPYVGDSTYDERYAKYRPIDRGAWLLHGHVHGAWRQRGRMYNVGVDAHGGYPVRLSTALQELRAGRDRPPPPWASARQCTCSRLDPTEAPVHPINWDPDCTFHGVGSVWWCQPEQAERRAAHAAYRTARENSS